MRNECNIVRDLLPLYAENMVSVDTEEFVKEHLDGCAECRQEYDRMKAPQANQTKESQAKQMKEEAAPLVKLKQKMRRKRIQTILCTGFFVMALLVSAFAVLSAPVYFPYEEDLLTITENADESITVTFNEKVTDYRCKAEVFDYAEDGMSGEARTWYQIEAWTSLWNEWFSDRGVQSTTICEDAERVSVYYLSNDGGEDICVYGQPLTSGGVITLPRHVLSFYFMLALFCAVVLFVIWCIVRRKTTSKVWIERILLYPVSYCIGHVIVTRFGSSSYSAQRDFMLIVFISILLYGGLLLARNVYRTRKEIKELTECK